MAFPWDVALFILAFVVIVVMLIRMATKARRAQDESSSASESPHERLLLKFVEDASGKRVGETVAVEGDNLIVKDGRGFLVVPSSMVTEAGGGLKLAGSLDEAAARAKGEAWREKSHKVITYKAEELPKDEEPAS